MKFNVLLAILVGFAALISIPAIAIILLQWLEPDPIRYVNIPFQVLTDQVQVGTGVPVRITRCVEDPFINVPFLYGFTSELVSEDTNFRIITGGSTAVIRMRGCETVDSVLSIVPSTTPFGRYHLEGTTTSIGRFRLSPTTLLWSSTSFDVIAALK